MIFTLTDRQYNVLDVLETDAYLIGQYTASFLETLDIDIPVNSLNPEYWVEGNYIMCRDSQDRNYWFTIVDESDGLTDDVKTLSCYSSTFDIFAEDAAPISATEAKEFEWYYSQIFNDTGVSFGSNFLTGKTRKLEYTSTDKSNAEMLQFVLNGFDNAEGRFEVEFEGTAPKRLIFNAYERIGEEEPQTLVSDDDDRLTSLTRTGSVSEIGTCLNLTGATPESTDTNSDPAAITLIGKYYEEMDSEGNILYYSPTNDSRIYSVEAHKNYYVQLPGKANGEFDGYISRNYESEAATQDALWSAGLTKLKSIDHAILTYEAKGNIDCRLGDNIQIIAHSMKSEVMISARVIEYKFNDDDDSKNEYTFSNYVELESNIDDISSQMKQLKKELENVNAKTKSFATTDQLIPLQEGVDSATAEAQKANEAANANKAALEKVTLYAVYSDESTGTKQVDVAIDGGTSETESLTITVDSTESTADYTVQTMNQADFLALLKSNTSDPAKVTKKITVSDFVKAPAAGKVYQYVGLGVKDSELATDYEWNKNPNFVSAETAKVQQEAGEKIDLLRQDLLTQISDSADKYSESLIQAKTEAQALVDNANAKWKEKVDAYDTEIADLKVETDKIVGIAEQADTTAQTVDTQKQTITNLVKKTDENGTSITEMQQDAKTIKETVSNANDKITQTTKDVNSLKGVVADAASKTEVEQLADKVTISVKDAQTYADGAVEKLEVQTVYSNNPEGMKQVDVAIADDTSETETAESTKKADVADFTKDETYQADGITNYYHYVGTGVKDSQDPSDYKWQLNPDWIKAQYDAELANKVNSDEYVDALARMIGTEEYEAFKEQTEALRKSYEAFVANDYTSEVTSLEARASGLEVSLDNKIAEFDFLRTYIKLGEEGLVIGSDDSPLKMVLSKDKLAFVDGGTTVAYFTNQSFYINRGAIVESLQVGSHKMTKIDDSSTVFQYVGGGS